MKARIEDLVVGYRRTKPYTEIGIRRLKCFRVGCNNRAATQWQICADGRTYRPVCLDCDIDLNRIVLEWAGLPDRDVVLARYVARVRGGAL